MRQAEVASDRALELDPDLSIAHKLRAHLDVDLGHAEEGLRRLLQQAQGRPADPKLFGGLVQACRFCGLLDASKAAHEEARRLDPRATTSVLHTYIMEGDYDRVLSAHDNREDLLAVIALWMLGRREEAITTLKLEEGRYAGHGVAHSFFSGHRAVLEGRRDDALRALEVVTSSPFADGEGLFYVANMLLNLGVPDDALAVLDQAVGRGFFCFPVFARHPWLDPLRGRSPFRAMVQRIEQRHRAAAQMFVDLGGEQLLGVRTRF